MPLSMLCITQSANANLITPPPRACIDVRVSTDEVVTPTGKPNEYLVTTPHFGNSGGITFTVRTVKHTEPVCVTPGLRIINPPLKIY